MKICLLLHLFLLLQISLSGQVYEEGEVYTSENEYVEYLHGNLPLIISVPHGGEKKPENIPDRDCSGCVYINDSYTQELAREITEEIILITGCIPYVIINRLHRSKLDANRAIIEAADRNLEAESAWNSYHEFIDVAREQILSDQSKGLFIDLHGHGHEIQRIELGYLLLKSDLMEESDHLNDPEVIGRSSVMNLVHSNLNGLTHSDLLIGANSLGSILDVMGYNSVPSENDMTPMDDEPYFRGGYNTDRYGSHQGQPIDAIQVECHQEVRFNRNIRVEFAKAVARTLLQFLEVHYFDDLYVTGCNSTGITKDVFSTSLRLFPNPSESTVIINSPVYPVKVNLMNTMGQILLSKEILSESQEVDLSDLIPGIYYISFIYNREIVSIKKVIKI